LSRCPEDDGLPGYRVLDALAYLSHRCLLMFSLI
jgi:hypothetical protein